MADPLRCEPRWKMWGCLSLLLIGLHVCVGPQVQLSKWALPRASNSALDEAIQWKHGKLNLSDARSDWEAPLIGGKRYNVFGQAFVLICLFGTTWSEWLGAPPDTFHAPLYVLLIAMPLPLIAFGAFRSITRSSAWGAVLAASLIAGTSVRPVMTVCRDGSIYQINHLLAVMGLLLLAADLLGPRRIWPAIIGLALAVWSRQMTAFYAIPLLWIALRTRPESDPRLAHGPSTDELSRAGKHSFRPIIVALIGIFIVAAYPMTLNYLKMGNPFDAGYRALYAGRTDPIALDAHTCFWGPHWFGRQFAAMNLTIPKIEIRGGSIYLDSQSQEGASVWLTTPMLLAVFLTARRWWRDPARRVLMLSTLLVIIGLFGYHTTGAQRYGYYRYSLDFIPIWLAVVAPYLTTRLAMPWTLAAFAWSALYFNTLTP